MPHRMGIYVPHLRDLIIIPTLKETHTYNKSAIPLILLTAAQETGMGYYLQQLNGGPAQGLYQTEPPSFYYTIEKHLPSRPPLAERVCKSLKVPDLNHFVPEDMIYNLKLATIMCRLHYLRINKPLPNSTDIAALAAYWKKYYNSPSGKGTVTEAIDNYERYVGD